MIPDVTLALCFFAFQRVLSTKINYDLNTDHPTKVNDLSIVPRAMSDYVGIESPFRVTLTLLSVLLITLIALNIQSLIAFTMSLLLSTIDIARKVSL